MTPTSPPPGFKGGFFTRTRDRAPYAISTGPYRSLPAAVAVPGSVEDVQALMRWSTEEGIYLIPRGAGTGMPGGNIGPSVVVSIEQPFHWLGRPQLEAGTIRVGAAAVAAQVQGVVAAAGLDFPPLPSSAAWATVGGLVAAGAAGARSFGLGAVGDWVESLEVVLADGSVHEITRGQPAVGVLGSGVEARIRQRIRPLMAGWPRVRKNASGLRLDRFEASGDVIDLVVASEGTLAVVTAATLRLRKPPLGRRLVVVGAAGIQEVSQWAEIARDVGASACEFIGPWLVAKAHLSGDARVGPVIPADGGAVVLIELEGDPPRVQGGLATLEEAASSLSPGGFVHEDSEGSPLWGLRRRASPIIHKAAQGGLRSMQFIEDSVVPPDRLAEYVQDLSRILADAGTEAAMFGHAGDANVHVNPLVDVTRQDWKERVAGILEHTATLVSGLGGTLSGEHGDGRVRAPFLDRVWGAEAVGAFREVKAAFDPDGRLNPGVILPVPGQDPLDTLTAEPPLSLH